MFPYEAAENGLIEPKIASLTVSVQRHYTVVTGCVEPGLPAKQPRNLCLRTRTRA
jgi:hypothetical protein